MALLARSYANLGKLTDSLAWCQQAVALDKLNADYRHLLADIQQELGQTGEAVTSLRQALYLDPGLVLAHFALGSLTRRQGRHKESHKHFENALSLIEKYLPDDILPESDGVTAGRLKEIILGMTGREIKV